MSWTRRTAAIAGPVLLTGLLTACQPDAPVATRVLPDSPAVPAGLLTGCPPRDAPLRQANGPLPPGATAVRLCQGVLEGADVGFVPPDDLLTEGVSDVLAAVNGLPPFEPGEDGFCPAVGGYTLVYWFLYPDGDARAVDHHLAGCAETFLGPDDVREDGASVAAAFEEALHAQRAGTEPPGASEAPDCDIYPWPATATLRLPEPPDLDAMVLCRPLPARRGGPTRWRQVPLDEETVAAIESDYHLDDASYAGSCGRLLGLTVLRGRTTWDDDVRLAGGCEQFLAPTAAAATGADGTQAWHASPEVMALLERAARRTR